MDASSAPTPRRLLGLAVAVIATNVAIVVTGGVVRVTGSGLGCPDWPACEGGRVVPRPGGDAGWHQFVEFGNRLVTFVVLAAAVALFVALRRRLRHGPAVRWSGWLVAGIVGQGVLGGVTVLVGLHPLVVAAHFLASMGLIAIAVTVHHRLVADGRPGGPAAPTPLRRLATAVLVLAATVLVVGTLVTAAGPHAGDPGTPRLGLDIRSVTRVHTTAVWLTVAATVAGWLAARRAGVPSLRRAFLVLLAVEVAQGAIGYTQYHLGIPAWLVSLHLLGASLFWVAAVRVRLVAADGRVAAAAASRPLAAPVAVPE